MGQCSASGQAYKTNGPSYIRYERGLILVTTCTLVSLIGWGNTNRLFNHAILLFWSLEEQLMPHVSVHPCFVLLIWRYFFFLVLFSESSFASCWWCVQWLDGISSVTGYSSDFMFLYTSWCPALARHGLCLKEWMVMDALPKKIIIESYNPLSDYFTGVHFPSVKYTFMFIVILNIGSKYMLLLKFDLVDVHSGTYYWRLELFGWGTIVETIILKGAHVCLISLGS